MKGINCCGDCVYYSTKKHKCTRGAHIETDPKAPFYDDCPLPDVECVELGTEWEYWPGTAILNAGWRCGACGTIYWDHGINRYKYCPECGRKKF